MSEQKILQIRINCFLRFGILSFLGIRPLFVLKCGQDKPPLVGSTTAQKVTN
jgi:hypothetical protein